MLHVSASAGFLPTYNLLFTVHQYVFCKHKRTWIRLIAKLPKTHLKLQAILCHNTNGNMADLT